MAFLRAAVPEDYLDAVPGQNVVLRPPSMSDYAAWAELRALSRSHLIPWEPLWAANDLSRAMYRRRLRAYAKDVRDDLAYSFFITERASDTLLGGITLSNVRRGSAQSASLGYWIGAPHARRGFMLDAVTTVLPFAFSSLRFHRIEAASMPGNAASLRVLERAGFEREGFAHGYLKINGRWEDHVLFARVAPVLAAATAADRQPGAGWR
jgi:[ribosomal protein S5]-alanine N-acetyltransferase